MQRRHRAKSIVGRMSAGLVALAVGIAAFGVSGLASATTLKELQQRGYVRIAIANEPPYTEVKPTGEVTGAAPEVVRAVFKELGVPQISATVTEYGAMIPGLQAGRFDVIAAGLFMKPARCAAVAYSEPDLCGAEGMLVKKGNPLKIESHADVAKNKNAKIGVCGGCIEEKYAKDAGVPQSRIVIVPDIISGVKMVEAGRIDAYAMPELSLADAVKKTHATDVEIYAPTKNTPISCAGAAFRKSDTALRDAYDKVLARFKKDGTFAKILKPWGFSAKAAMMTSREKLCKGSS